MKRKRLRVYRFCFVVLAEALEHGREIFHAAERSAVGRSSLKLRYKPSHGSRINAGISGGPPLKNSAAGQSCQ